MEGERAEQDDGTLPPPMPRRWRVVLVGVATMAVVAAGGVAVGLALSGGERLTDEERAFCDALTEPFPLAERWQEGDVVVFFEPDHPGELVEVVRRLVADVALDVRFVDHAEAYEEFLEAFGDDQEMVAAVEPEILPPSLRVDLREGARFPAEEVDALDGIFRVVHQLLPEEPRVVDVVELVTARIDETGGDRTPVEVDLASQVETFPPEVHDDVLLVDQSSDGRPLRESRRVEIAAAAERTVSWYDETCTS